MNTCEHLDALIGGLIRGVENISGRRAAMGEHQDITSNDMRVICAIGVGSRQNMSSIAKKLSVTVGTLTISINSLVKKGYVLRERGEDDRRVVYISLTEKGREAYIKYEEFRLSIMQAALNALTPEESEALMKSLEKLNDWVYSYSVSQSTI